MDPLIASAQEWQEALTRGQLTSVDLVTKCLQQIEQHNHQGYKLRAIINSAPWAKAIEKAKVLDKERADGHVRSPLHGIPIVIKDIYPTDASMGMPTTCGAAALASAVGRKNCELVDKLLAAGLIVIGKANLTEFCGLRAKWMRMGLSAIGGQTQSPYVRGGLDEDDAPLGNTHIGGSSSGSAAAVSAGFAPLAIGSETSGSLIVPANRAGLFSLKVTNGRAPLDGAQHLSYEYDSLGGMTKTARDLVNITRVLIGSSLSSPALDAAPTSRAELPMKGLKIAFVNHDEARFSDGACSHTSESRSKLGEMYQAAIDRIERAGARVVRNVSLPDPGSIAYKENSIVHQVAFSEIDALFKDFFGSLDNAPVKTLSELIEWNESHPAEAMPEPYANQIDLIAARDSKLSADERREAIAAGHRIAGTDGIEKAMIDHDVELFIGPADGAIYCLTAAAGFPIGTVPLGMVEFNSHGQSQHRPDGLCVFGKANSDERILEFMLAYDSVFQFRPSPKMD